MLDANFHLKRWTKNVLNDAALSDGLLYFVKNDIYKEHTKNISSEKDVCFTLFDWIYSDMFVLLDAMLFFYVTGYG